MQPADDDRSEPRRHSGPRPLVSVGMPVYNGEAYVEAAIRSVLDQTLSALELIIYDNASTDRTGDICARYAASDGRVRYFRNAENLGAHPNYNLTFRPATGKYFKWAAHDDVLKPTYLERCVAALEKTPDAVVCQSTLEYIDAEDEIIGVYDSNLVGSASDSAATRFASVILRPHPAYEIMGVFRRDALLDSMLLESFHGADRALLAEVSLRGRMLRVAEPLLRVREHKGRYTQSHIRPKERAVWHDSRLRGKLSLPTWRLYSEYGRMLARNRVDATTRVRCYGHLLRWWWHNWNGIRMVVDVASVVMPDAVVYAERFKQKYVAPQPGAGDVVKRESGDSSAT